MSTIRVLVADDDEDIRAALADLIGSDPQLELTGLATDADEAIRVAQAEHPDVILMDVRMPGGGGSRATREIRTAVPLARVVALSAYGDRATVLDILTAGAVGYVAKGATAKEILKAIHNAATGHSSISPEISTEIVSELSERLETQVREEAVDRARRERIEDALTRKGAIRQVFQPVVDLATGRITALEALSRFDATPPRPPDEWFRDAESVERRPQLELTAARLALDRLADLPAHIALAINVSPGTIMGPAFADLIPAAVAERIVVEVTEHAPVADYESLQRSLEGFRKLGGRLAVDDAGAGFASLRHILQLNPDVIKLDLSLTRQIDVHRRRRALAAALISFAREIGVVVIAEGIETAKELETLRELGVAYGQGYYLCRPTSLEQALSGVTAPPAGVDGAGRGGVE